MKQAAQAVVLLSVVTLGGCSGAGAPARSARLGTLEAVARDHLTALLHVKRWLAILYPTPPKNPCQTSAQRLKRQPGDPPGSTRMRLRLSDCTEIDVFQLADGSGSQEVTFPDGQQKTVRWGVARREPGWVKQDVDETLWDGHRLRYEVGISTAGAPYDRYEEGRATLADGHSMQFRHDRNLNRDAVDLQPNNGSELRFEVPLQSVAGAPFRPVHETGIAGALSHGAGYTHTFAVLGTDAEGWTNWALSAPDGITGSFRLDGELAGSGTLSERGKLVALLTWSADGQGTLTPIGGPDVEVGASAAARAFQVDQWIRNIAALGPSPMY
ncbi:MAG: hypothetical protein FJX74_08190 [Armatimonadetes bacterium]|nr:hypothetical protein [Armatimonadota bacterium]